MISVTNETEMTETVKLFSSETNVPECTFKPGTILFARLRDEPYFVAKIITVDTVRRRCYARFETDKTHWIRFNDIQRKNLVETSQVCSLCLGRTGDIIRCSSCQLGFHGRCHNPILRSLDENLAASWQCQVCIYRTTGCKNEIFNKTIKRTRLRDRIKTNARRFPYDPTALDWDKKHRVNRQDCYCYCGKSGRWTDEMLQCAKCLQWFHKACLSCLTDRLMSGDLMVLFVCCVCVQSGPEFFHCIEKTWTDLAHLALFNLKEKKKKNKKYFDLRSDVMPWINRHWNYISAPKLKGLTKLEREEHVYESLKNDTDRFRRGKDSSPTDGRGTTWRLRNRLPLGPPDFRICEYKFPLTHKLLDQLVSSMHSPIKLKRKSAAVVRARKEKRPPEKKKSKRSVSFEHRSGNKKSVFNERSKSPPHPSTSSRNDDARPLRSDNEDDNDDCFIVNGSETNSSLDEIIPLPPSYDGADHPFKTTLEREEELETTEMRQRILTSYARDRSDELASASATEPIGAVATERTASTVLPEKKKRKYTRRQTKRSRKEENRWPPGFNGVDVANHLKHPKNVLEKSAIDDVAGRDVPLSRLQSSVGNYFGAADRLHSGERFKILGRRVTADDTVQYLVEWEGGLII